MNLTPLKYLLLIENVTTVFRNYLCLKRRTRIIVLLWVLFESFNISLCIVANYSTDTRSPSHRIYFFSSAVFSIYVMIASLCYCKRFYSLLLNFDSFYNIFDDNLYNQIMQKAQKNLTAVVVTFSFILNILFTYVRVSSSDGEMGLVANTVFQYINTMSDFRYVFQYYILRCILFVVSEQLKAITRSIDSELLEITENHEKLEHAENLSRVAVNHEKLNKWVKAYENVNDSSNLCNSIFSIQLTIMILIVTAYYIILLYYIAIITVEGTATLTSLLPNLLSMTVFLSALLLISHAGQQIQNSYVELRQKICEICLHTMKNEEYYKLTKDLLRYVRTRPIRVHVFGTQDVNMSMLPAIVGLFTTYTVIVLQFNNVL